MIRITDNALDNFEQVERRIRSGRFASVTSETDSVQYPGIGQVPTDIGRDIDRAIRLQYPTLDLETRLQFARLSLDSDVQPHGVHNDRTEGDLTSILYLCDEGSTDLCKHRILGFDRQPETEAQYKIWQRDHSRPAAWTTTRCVQCRRNRLFSFPSELLHRQFPASGFGTGPEDGRLVIVTFSRHKKAPNEGG